MKTSNATLMSECRECSGAGMRTHDHPNDPWARVFECEECHGEGLVIQDCQCCQDQATEVFDGLSLCESCAEEQRADMLS